MPIDEFYYNFLLNNDKPYYIPASLINRLQGPIMDDPSKYRCSIVRFEISSNLPLFVPILTVDDSKTNTYITNMSVTLQYLAVSYQVFVPITTDMRQNGVFDISLFLDQVNIALAAAYVSAPLNPTATPPFLYLDTSSSLIRMVVDVTYLTASPTISIWFNQYLQDVLNFPASVRPLETSGTPLDPNGLDYMIAITNSAILLPSTGNRPGYPVALNTRVQDQIYIDQDYVQLSTFSDISTIQFTSSLLPIVQEFIPTTTSQSQNSNINSSTVPIITDFVVTSTNQEPRPTTFVYLPTAQYRYVDFLSPQTPVNTVDLNAFYTLYTGEQKPFLLPPGGFMSLKLLIERK